MATININTKDGSNQITTENLRGNLMALIVSFMDSRNPKFKLKIESELGYTIFDNSDISMISQTGDKAIYYTLSNKMIDKHKHSVDQWVPFFIDEKLIVSVEGERNQDLQIVLRIA